MRIGLDCRAAAWYRGTGIGNYSYKLIKNMLSISKDTFDMYTPEESFIDHFSDIKPNINIYPISFGDKSGFWNKIDSSTYSVDDSTSIFHTPQNGIGLPTAKNCPTIVTLHDIIPDRMPETVSPTFNTIYHNSIRKVLETADGIITVSNFSKEDIIKEYNIPPEKIIVTHLASDETYKPLNMTLAKSIVKNKLRISDDYILYMGGFTPRKNIMGILQAYERNLHKLKGKYKLVIAGKKGLSYSIYRDYIQKHNLSSHVIFTDFVDNKYLPFLYNAASLFIFPSFYEGFGLPPLEAMACGTPVIASNVTSIPEVLKDGAEYVNPHDVDDIANSMLAVLENDVLRNSLIKRGLSVNSKYSWRDTADKTLTYYKTFIER